MILLTLRTEDAPYVHNVRRVQIEQLSPSFWRVVASYGWRETPNVEEVFHRCGLEGLSCRMMETSFFMSHESLIIGKRPWYLRLRGKLYLLLQRNALRAPDQLRSRQTGLSSSVPRSKSDVKKALPLRRAFFSSGCYVLSLPRETFRWRSHFSLLVMVSAHTLIIIILAKRFASGAKKKNEKGTVLNADISAVISAWATPIRWWSAMPDYRFPAAARALIWR